MAAESQGVMGSTTIQTPGAVAQLPSLNELVETVGSDAACFVVGAHMASAAREGVLDVKGLRADRFIYRDASGQLQLNELERPCVTHSVQNLVSLKRGIKLWAEEVENGSAVLLPEYEVFINASQVAVILDPARRQNAMRMAFVYSPQWSWLFRQNAEGGEWLNQREMVEALRTTLVGCILGPVDLLSKVRSVASAESNDGQSDIQQGKRSVSAAVQRRAIGFEDVPELITVKCSMFLNADLLTISTVEIDCTFHVDWNGQQGQWNFRLAPVPGTIEKAVNKVTSEIGEVLVHDHGLTEDWIVFGTPGFSQRTGLNVNP